MEYFPSRGNFPGAAQEFYKFQKYNFVDFSIRSSKENQPSPRLKKIYFFLCVLPSQDKAVKY